MRDKKPWLGLLGTLIFAVSMTLASASAATADEKFEVGHVTVTSSWQTVQIDAVFDDPVVVAGPATRNELDPGFVEVANVDPTSFDIRFREWAYLDGAHGAEEVSYLVVERGTTILESGVKVEAGTVSLGSSWQRVNYDSNFPGSNPTLLLTVADNQNGPVAPRVRNANRGRFDARQWVEEGTAFQPTTTANWVAWGVGNEPSIDGPAWETGQVPVDEVIEPVNYSRSYDSPCLLADINSPTSNPVTLRAPTLGPSSASLVATEEQAGDSETVLGNETVRYLVVECGTGSVDVTPPDWGGVGLVAGGLSSTGVTLGWSPGATDDVGVVAYFVFQDGIEIGSTAQTSFVVGGLVPETEYELRVEAEDAAGNRTDDGPTLTVTTPPAPVDVTPPDWGGVGLVAGGLSSTGVTLGWSPGATDDVGVVAYFVFQDGIEIGSTAQTSFVVGGLVPETEYEFRVEAEDAAGNRTDDGPTLTVTTPDPSSDVTPPTWGSTVLSANHVGKTWVNLGWAPGATDDSGAPVTYQVLVNGSAEAFVTGPSYTVGNLSSATSYAFQVVAIDGAGNTSQPLAVTAATDGLGTGPHVESGNVDITDGWTTVQINRSFADPIVVVGPTTENQSDPGFAIVDNVTPTSFDIRFEEWDYLDGVHGTETVSYLIAERGVTILPSGAVIEAGSVSATGSYQRQDFTASFGGKPAMAMAPVGDQGPLAVTQRLKGITGGRFDYRYFVQESSNASSPRPFNWLAWKAGSGSGSGGFAWATTQMTTDENYTTYGFGSAFGDPCVFGEVYSNLPQPASISRSGLTTQQVDLRIAEEQSHDSETNLGNEGITLLVMECDNSVPATDQTAPVWGASSLALISATSSSIRVGWSPGATDADPDLHYRILVDGVEAGMTSGTSFTVGSLDPSTTYGFEVIAIDSAGNQSGTLGPLSAATLAVGQYSLSPYDWRADPNFSINDLPTATAIQAYQDFRYGLDNPGNNFRQPPSVYLAAMGATPFSHGTYSYARNGGHWLSSISEALRATGDPALVDELLLWSGVLKPNLADHDGRGYPYFQYRGPNGNVNTQHYATDTNLLDEQLLAGVIARMGWALHENRHISVLAGSEADFWFDYLDKNWVPKWQARATRTTNDPYVPPANLGLQNATGWTSPDSPQHNDLGFNWAGGHSFADVPGVTHTFPVRQIMHTYIASIYQYLVMSEYFADTGRPSVFGASTYAAEAAARHDYWHAKTSIGSDGSREIPHLIRDGVDSPDTDSYVRHLALYATEMHWMGFGNFAGEPEMAAYTKIFYNPAAPNDDVYDAGNSTTMTKYIDATGSELFAMTFNSLWTPWDPSGELMNLNLAAILSVDHHKILNTQVQRHGSHYNGILSFELYNSLTP